MKKILILAYDFPPYVSVGGLRPYFWYKYLKKNGIYPVVITRQWDNKYGNYLDYVAPGISNEIIEENTEYGTIIRTSYNPNLANRILLKYGKRKLRFIRKIVSTYYEIMQWFFSIGQKVELYFAAKEYLINNKVDIIIATGEPFILFKYASFLSEKYHIPWIADYRDPWTQNKIRSKNVLLHKFNALLEKKYLSNVSFIVTVSDFVENHIKTLIDDKDFEIIINGYDPDVVSIVLQTKPDDENFVISYAGTIYDWHPVERFLKQCNTFVTKKKIKNLKINFYGINKEEWIKSLINAKFNGLVDIVFFYKKLPNKQLIQKLAESHLLLLFNYYSYAGTKIYDYLAAKRKILFCYSHDEKALQLKKKYYNIEESLSDNNHIQEDIIKETNSGVIVRDEEHLLEVLEKLYLEFQEKREIKCEAQNIERFSRKLQTKKLAELIKRTIDSYHSKCLVCNSNKLNQLNGYEKDFLVKCQSCGFVFSQKIPTDKEIINHYEEYSRNDYLSPITVKRYNELLDTFERYRKTNKILDVGAGIGYFLDEAKKRGWEVYGNEITKQAVNICTDKGITMFKGKIGDAPFPENSFDVITSFEVIEHINNPRQELESIYRLLRKNGVFYFTTPNFNAVERYLLKEKYNIIYYPEHLSYYSSKTINFLMDKFSFKRLFLKTTGFSFTRFKSKGKLPPHIQIITPTAEDERIRNRIEKNPVLKLITKIMNVLLNLFKIGNSLKGLYQKR